MPRQKKGSADFVVPALPGAPEPQGSAPSPTAEKKKRTKKVSVGTTLAGSPPVGDTPVPVAKRARKPMTEEQKERARANLAKARAVREANKQKEIRRKKREALKETAPQRKALREERKVKKVERIANKKAYEEGSAPVSLTEAHRMVSNALKEEIKERIAENKQRFEEEKASSMKLKMKAKHLTYTDPLVKEMMEGHGFNEVVEHHAREKERLARERKERRGKMGSRHTELDESDSAYYRYIGHNE